MKKTLKYICIILISILTLTSCGQYRKEAGRYDCIVYNINGNDILSQYIEFYINLQSNGKGEMIEVFKKPNYSIFGKTYRNRKVKFQIEGEILYLQVEDNGKYYNGVEYVCKNNTLLRDKRTQSYYEYVLFVKK